MSALVFSVSSPGMLTTVQDEGRWGFQGKGMPVAGAMDIQSLKLGNILVGNPEGAAALEVTILGPTLRVEEGEGVVAVTGAELSFTVNGAAVPNWTVVYVRAGDTLAFGAPLSGCRAYLCVSGGIDVPVVMGSRSTYTRAKVGGVDGRALKKDDGVRCGDPAPLWRSCEGMTCPEALRAIYDAEAPLRVVAGLQEDHFTDKGIETLYSSEYTISNSADRMGYRLDGPVVEHVDAADIISDPIALGAVQVPGHGQPIIMLADRQTTGGYTKIGTVCSVDVAALSQRLPGHKVHFSKITLDDAVALVRGEAQKRAELLRLRAQWRSTRGDEVSCPMQGGVPTKGAFLLRVDGSDHRISWEEGQG